MSASAKANTSKKKGDQKTKEQKTGEQTPEDQIELVFYGTNLSKESLWIENYDFLQFKMCDLFENWNQVKKVSHFVNKDITQEELNDRSGLEIIEKDKFVCDPKINEETLTAFLLGQEDKKFDVVFWMDSNNLVDIFVDTKDIRTLFDSDIRILFKKIKDFYSSLKPSAVLVNLVHHEQNQTTGFCGFEDFYDYPGLWCLDTFLFLVKVMNRLFDKLEPGVYQKKAVENLDGLIEECYHSTLEELFNLGVENFEEKQKLIQMIDQTYFHERLSKSGLELERPLVNCISTLVEETIKQSNLEEESNK
jgi:hypothetical protein